MQLGRTKIRPVPGVATSLASRRRSSNAETGIAPRGDGSRQPVVPAGGEFLDLVPEPPALPGWRSEADIDVLAADYARTRFTGGLNW